MSSAPVARPRARALRLVLRDLRVRPHPRTGQRTSFKVKRDSPLEDMARVVAQRLAVPRARLVFSRQGAWLDCSCSPAQLGLGSHDDVDCDLDVDMEAVGERIPEDLEPTLGGGGAVVFCIRGLEDAATMVDVPQHFVATSEETLAKFLDTYAARRSRYICVLRFTFNGRRIIGRETAAIIGLKNGATIECKSMFHINACSLCQLSLNCTSSTRVSLWEQGGCSSDDILTFRIKYKSANMTHFSIPFTRHPFDTLKTAFRAFIARTGFNQEEARFWHQGWLIDERDTLESIGIQGGDSVFCGLTDESEGLVCAICAGRQQEVPVTLRIRDEQDSEFEFKIAEDSPFKELYVQYADRVGVCFVDVLLFRGDHRILLRETPKQLNLSDLSVLTSIVFRSSTCVCCKSRSMDVPETRVRDNVVPSSRTRSIIVNTRVVDELGTETVIKVWSTTSMRTVLEVYCEARQRVVDGLLFLFRGKLVHYDETPATMGLTDHDVVVVGSQTTVQFCRGCNPAEDIRSHTHIDRNEGHIEDLEGSQVLCGVLSVALCNELEGGLAEFVRLWQQESRRRVTDELRAAFNNFPQAARISHTNDRLSQLHNHQLEKLRKEIKEIAARASNAESAAREATREAQRKTALARQVSEEVVLLKRSLANAVEAKQQAEIVAAKAIQTSSDSRQKVAGEFAKTKKVISDAERAMNRARNAAANAKLEAEAEVAKAKAELDEFKKKAFVSVEETKMVLARTTAELKEAKAREVRARKSHGNIWDFTLVLSDKNGNDMVAFAHGSTQLQRLVSAYAVKFGLNEIGVELHWNTKRLHLHDTPNSIGLQDGCVLQCVMKRIGFCPACVSRKVNCDGAPEKLEVKQLIRAVSVRIVDEDLNETQATIPNQVNMGAVIRAFQAYRLRMSEELVFFYRGERVRCSQTPASLELGNSSVLFCAHMDSRVPAFCADCLMYIDAATRDDADSESTSTEGEDDNLRYARQIKMHDPSSSLGLQLHQGILNDRPEVILSKTQVKHQKAPELMPQSRSEKGSDEAVASEATARQGKRLVTIHIKGADGKDVYYKIKGTTKLQKVFDAYVETLGSGGGPIRFRCGGKYVIGVDTPNKLYLGDDDVIECVQEQEVSKPVTPKGETGEEGVPIARNESQVTLRFRDMAETVGAGGQRRIFTQKRTSPLHKALDRFALRVGGQREDFIFILPDGRRLSREQTPAMLGLQDADEVLCFGTRVDQPRR